MQSRTAKARAFFGQVAMLVVALAPAACGSGESGASSSGGDGGQPAAGGASGTAGHAQGGASASSAGGASGGGGQGGAAAAGLIKCTHPGNAGTPTKACDFVLSPNAIYPNGDTNNDLPPVNKPGQVAPRGDADPCAREDPTSHVTYVSYTLAGGGTGALDTYLASTVDGGAHWKEAGDGAVWSGQSSVPDPYTGGTPGNGMVNSETSNLTFRVVQGGVIVYGIHSVYWSGDDGDDKHTQRLDLSETFVPAGSTPAAIHDALKLAVDGASNVDPIGAWPDFAACPGPDCSVPGNPSGKPVRNLQVLDHQGLGDCARFHEPALHWSESDQTLYLLVHCQSSTDNRFEVFGTPSAAPDANGQGNPSLWNWVHQGPLLRESDAHQAAVAYNIDEPTGAYFTQGELATGAGGQVLVLGSLVHLLSDGSEARDAQFVFEVKSLKNPALTAPLGPTPGAAPYVAAVQMKLDINNGDRGRGPGSATYDRSLSAVGLIYAGRTFPNTSGADTAFETDFFSFPSVTP